MDAAGLWVRIAVFAGLLAAAFLSAALEVARRSLAGEDGGSPPARMPVPSAPLFSCGCFFISVYIVSLLAVARRLLAFIPN